MTAKRVNALLKFLKTTLTNSDIDHASSERVIALLNSKKVEITELLSRKKSESTGPKKPKTNYMFFQQEMMPEIKKKHPTASLPERSGFLSEMWHALSPAEKQKYADMAKKDKERYSKETGTTSVARTAEKSTDKAPRKYDEFCRRHREEVKSEHPDWKPQAVKSELSRRWKEMTDEQKNEYTTVRNPVMEIEEEEEVKEVAKPAKQKEEVKEVKKPAKQKEEVKKPAKQKEVESKKFEETPGFLTFWEEKYDEVKPKMGSETKTKAKVIEMWNQLDEEDRENYELAAVDDGSEGEEEDLEEEDD